MSQNKCMTLGSCNIFPLSTKFLNRRVHTAILKEVLSISRPVLDRKRESPTDVNERYLNRKIENKVTYNMARYILPPYSPFFSF